MTDWYTSDTHFGHRNIVDFCDRQFGKLPDGQIDIQAHDEQLIARWNSVVRPGDRIIHHGDLTWHREISATASILERLNGQKFWVYGNHDNTEQRKAFGKYFVKSEYYLETRVGDQFIVHSHYPFLRWNKGHHGAYMLHGHVHGELDLKYPFDGRILDVGVDSWNGYPISFDQVHELLKVRPIIRDFER